MDPLHCNLPVCFFMKALAIILVGGAAKIAADGFFGVLALLRLLLQGERAASIFFFCPSTPVEATWKDEGSGLLPPFQWRK